ncbi:hypothetical protein F5Y18DRAFT_293815 [Xylariaceae sp. FL1019]|nr:hypothetical protein F5Y18DRAFT_293815 [Xylariaceae sp. FL1019]
MAEKKTILPKGIVKNRPGIYNEIAADDVMPEKMIFQFLKVYATTSRRLYDPTARRLENFWTRILGGNLRRLPAGHIAALFKQCSDETSTFVKLRGPDNRYEPPSPEAEASSPKRDVISPERPPHHSDKAAATSRTKAGPSRTKATEVLRPILKKPRGPSHSGPRPTARFVSPVESSMTEIGKAEAETALEDNTAGVSGKDKDSGSSTAKEDQKKGLHVRTKKKSTAFVASSASRRRPAMPRRSSSQSSNAASEIEPKEGTSSLGGSQSPVPTILEQSEQPSSSKSAEKEGVNTQGTKKRSEGQPNITDRGTKLSAKAAGKRPQKYQNVERAPAPEPQITSEGPQVIPTDTKKRTSAIRNDKNEKITGSVLHRSSKESQKAANPDSKGSRDRSRPRVIHNIDRSATDIGYKGSGFGEASRSIPRMSESYTQPKVDTSVVGQGTITGFTDNVFKEAKTTRRKEPDLLSCSVSEAAESSRPATQLSPTKPSDAEPIPLARSKSQLKLVLDRPGERKSKR